MIREHEIDKRWKWVERVVKSCQTSEQVDAASALVFNFYSACSMWHPRKAKEILDELMLDVLIRKIEIKNPFI